MQVAILLGSSGIALGWPGYWRVACSGRSPPRY
jgi:hypothetical protein